MQDSTQRQPAADGRHLSDAELAGRAAGGDAAAFEAIMRRHNQLLFRTARSILKSDADAEDALQEAWIKAWRALDGFRADARLSTWLVRITANEALGRLRRKHVPVVPLDAAMNKIDASKDEAFAEQPQQGPDAAAMRAQLRQLIEARVDQLPETFRAVFVLRAIEEMSVAEVAEALDIPEATVRTRYFRARSLMREGMTREVDIALNDAFAFDGARCDRIVAGVLARADAEGLVNRQAGAAHERSA